MAMLFALSVSILLIDLRVLVIALVASLIDLA